VGTKRVSFALFFLAIIYLSPYRSKSKTGLRIHIAGLIRLTRWSSRSLLGVPNACCRAYLVAKTPMTKRLPL
jgi:hypothetical protein